MRCALIFVWAAAAFAAEYDSSDVLKRAIQKVLDSARTIPNYTCVETVTRDYLEPRAYSLPRACPVLLKLREHPTPDVMLQPFSRDRLRLDVTMSSRGEIFAWSGAKQFEDSNVDKVVRNGPIATGSFGGFLIAVFESDVKKFNFERALQVPGTTLLEYSFQVAQADSHYNIKYDATSWMYVAYSGSFQLNAETADLVNMKLATGEMPPATHICLTTTNLDFERVQIGSGQFLLPKSVGQRFVYPDAGETENTTSLANCREFRGESTLTFSPGETAEAGVRRMIARDPPALPSGLRFTMALDAPIAADTAAAGDPFTGKLVEAARDYGGKVLAPKGTLVDGRLVRVQTFARPSEAVIVLKPEAMLLRGVRVAINAARDWTYVIAERRRQRKNLEIL
ncbi:MAG: hypothetical protein JWP63_4379, partial [Candidatus Solibacter sp.]|nr:hypothetical protein [Candidatus Solibacter sp.]